MSLTAEEKLRVVQALDALGVHMIEAGFPASNPKEQRLFELLAEQDLHAAEVVAFGMTRRRGVDADGDQGLRVLAECFAPVCTLVGKTSVLHVEKVVRASREENLRMIGDSVAFLVRAGKRVLFDAEHFFDGLALDAGYALDCLRAARDAGAERLVLCDTNGGSLPPQIRAAFAIVGEALGPTPLGIHTHDDSGCAVANTLAGVEAGATQVQGTINGIGERTGNANLVTIIADLQLKMGHQLLPAERLARLTETAHFVDELLNRAPDPAQPYVGKHAFAHKAGMHAAGVRTDAQTFEHVDPAVVGNDRDVLISELSGRGAIVEKAAGATCSSRSCPAAARSRRGARRGHQAHPGRQRGVRAAGGGARQGARAPGLSVRGRRRILRAADAQGGRRVRAAVPAGVLARAGREAGRRQGGDRGHGQDLAGR